MGESSPNPMRSSSKNALAKAAEAFRAGFFCWTAWQAVCHPSQGRSRSSPDRLANNVGDSSCKGRDCVNFHNVIQDVRGDGTENLGGYQGRTPETKIAHLTVACRGGQLGVVVFHQTGRLTATMETVPFPVVILALKPELPPSQCPYGIIKIGT